MNFASAAVSKAIMPILDGILAVWPTLPAEVRDVIEVAVREHGPDVAIKDDINAAGSASAFLNALWPVRQALPAEVLGLLEGGQVSLQPRLGSRGIGGAGSLSAEQRELVLQRMLSIVEFRRVS